MSRAHLPAPRRQRARCADEGDWDEACGAARVAAPELSPDQIEAVLAKLRSGSKRVERFAIRARFVVQYETGLRPSTIDGLSVPAHYSKGSASLRITPEIDKIRHDREVPLTAAAREALDAAIDGMPRRDDGKPYRGPIFGHHDYREQVAAAPGKACRTPPLRSSRARICARPG